MRHNPNSSLISLGKWVTGQKVQERLRFRLLVLGIPKCYINPYLELVNKWISCSGIEWTTDRLKNLKVDLIRRRSRQLPLSWVRKNRRGDIAGVLGGLFRWADKSEKNFRRCVQALMIYSYWVYPIATTNQLKKFKDGVGSAPWVPEKVLLRSVTYRARGYTTGRIGTPEPLVAYGGSPTIKAPRAFGSRSVPQNKDVLLDLQVLNYDGNMELYPDYKYWFEPVLKGFEERKRFLDTLRKPNYPYTPLVGKVAFIQESGGKLRYIASPFRIFQVVLRPLGRALYSLIRSLPWDCTHDQSAALEPVRLALEKGKRVYSIDLSSATDYFPLEIQVQTLRTVVPTRYHDIISLWAKLCRGNWVTPDGSMIKWERGQPLGMYPSFAAFALSHGMLLASCLKNSMWNEEFYVLGDDVVILDENVALRYMEILDQIGCPYSTSKTLISERIAEFSGKIITPFGVYPQMKWRELSDDNFLDLCRALGPKSRLLLRPRQRKVFDFVKNLMDPIGLNMSIPGDNLGIAIKRTLDSPMSKSQESVLSSLVGLRRRVHENLYSYGNPETISPEEIQEVISTFDENVKRAFSQTLFRYWEVTSQILEGLEGMPEALGIEHRLPLKTVGPSRVSQLERYERVLKYYA